jgi:hypothetical protein
MRIVLAVLMVAHGIAHLPGVLVSWQLRSFPEMPFRTTTILGSSLDVGGVSTALAFWDGPMHRFNSATKALTHSSIHERVTWCHYTLE